MVRVTLPESKLKKSRRRRRAVVAVLWLLAIALVVGGIAGFAHLPHLRVVSVEVMGVEGTEAKAVEQTVRGHLAGSYALLFPHNNVVLYPRAAIVSDILQKHPTFASVEVRATSLRALRVVVVERAPKALWCGGARAAPAPCLHLDLRGVAYEIAAEFEGPVYTKYYGALTDSALPRQYVREEKFRSLTALVGALEEQQGGKVASVEVDQAEDARLRFTSGFELIFALKDGGGDVFERFTLALTAEPFEGRAVSDFEYLDLRFGDRLYYKLKGEPVP